MIQQNQKILAKIWKLNTSLLIDKKYDFLMPMKDFPIGEVSDWCLYAGLSCDKIKDVPSVSELVDRLWSR